MPPLGQDLLSGLGANDQHATDAMRRVRLIDGSIAVGPIDVLQGAVTDDRHELVFVPRRSVTAHHLVDLRSDDLPDLRPCLFAGQAEDRWMLFRTQ